MDKIKRIEEYLEQAKFDLEIYKGYMNKSDAELKWQEGNTGRKVVKTLNASKTIILKARLISSLFYCIHVSQSNKLHIL